MFAWTKALRCRGHIPSRFMVRNAVPKYKSISQHCLYTIRTFGDEKFDAEDLDSKLMSKNIKCTVFDERGNVTAVSKEFPKKEFLKIDGIHPRDLRHIDNARDSIIPSILVRPRCILVNMLGIRAMIMHDKILVLDAGVNKDKTSHLGLFMYDLENKLRSTSSKMTRPTHEMSATQSYEMRALESILMNTVANLDIELKSHLKILNEVLEDLEHHVDRELLRELLVRSKSLSRFCQKSQMIRNVVNDLLDNDDDLVGLYLTEHHNGLYRKDTDHAEAELLLESYYKQFDEIVQQAEQVLSNIKSTEEIINIMLDSNRNSLMLMELKITIGTLGFTGGMFIASLYGMNLKNYMEESPYAMASVCIVATMAAVAVTGFNLRKLSSAKKVTMGTQSARNLSGTGTASFHGPHSYHYGYRKKSKKVWYWLFQRPHRFQPANFDTRTRSLMWKWLTDKKM